MKIADKVALVTGGGSGLGEATARLLAERGAKVAILDYNGDRAEEVAAQIGAKTFQVDVSDAEAVGKAVEGVASHFGEAARIAVSCAGVGLAARIVGREGKMSFDVFDRTLKVNLYGTYNVMSHAARMMMALDPDEGGERGVVINTASVAWQDGQLGQSAYAASKGAIASMCLPAAREFAQSAIRVMAIAPGLFNTPMMEGLPEDVTAKIVANIPHPARLGLPSEYALLATQIVENAYLNGTTIRLDASTRLPPR